MAVPVEEIAPLLLPTASTRERLRGLADAGLTSAEIASGVGVSVSSLRNWTSGQAEPRTDAAIALDDLRLTLKVLLDGGLSPTRAAKWLTSRNGQLDDARPLDRLLETPIEVLGAAHLAAIDEQTTA